jgi:hypothetical protein
MTEEMNPAAPAGPRWKPLSKIERRIVGVLVEKAKTTPDVYPMSLNALKNGCNQKNNRDPVTDLSEDDVEAALDRLKQAGAAGEVQGSGRVSKFRHYLYEWLGVDKIELAVMAELLLRGPQTEGELRGRASRMEPIADLSAMRQVLAGLKAKGLALSLTSEGRGHVVSHALYPPEELARLKSEWGSRAEAAAQASTWCESDSPARPHSASNFPAADELAALRREVDQLKAEVGDLRSQMEELKAAFG